MESINFHNVESTLNMNKADYTILSLITYIRNKNK